MATNTPPGWFPDQSDPHQLRWWDGEAWTSNTAPKPATAASGDDYATAAPLVPAAAPIPSSKPKRPWYFRWWAISLAVVVVLAIIGSFAPDEETKPAATGSSGAGDTGQATSEADEASTSVTASPTPVSEPEPEPEPVDTDGDGTNDEDDVRPKDPEVQTEDDIDTDGDGVADYQDDFPKDAEYSKDTDGDSVPDRLDAFPKDPEYSKDTDSDGVADAKDAFPSDPSQSKITSGDGERTCRPPRTIWTTRRSADWASSTSCRRSTARASRLRTPPGPSTSSTWTGTQQAVTLGQGVPRLLVLLAPGTHRPAVESVRRAVHRRRGDLRG